MALPAKNVRDEQGSDSEMDKGDMVLTEYDKTRVKVPVIRNRSIVMNTKILSTEFTCPICLDLLTTTMTTKECLHRFCSECISMALLRGNKECPTCRTKLVSKRSLRHDTNFDDLIRRIWPDRHKYNEMLEIANNDGDDALSSIVAFADEEGATRDYMPQLPPDYDPFDKDAPTPPALLDSRLFAGTSSPAELFEDGGRKTPPWFTYSDFDPKLMGKREKKMFMEAQKAYLKLKSRRLGGKIDCLERIFDYDHTTETYSKTSRETNSPMTEPHSKMRKTNNGGVKKVLVEPREDAKSQASSMDSQPDSDSDDGAQFEAELDTGEMEDAEMMDSSLFLIKTSKEYPKKQKFKEVRRKEIVEAVPQDQPGTSGTSVIQMHVSNPTHSSSLDPSYFDPRTNLDPPYPENLEQFCELMPNGKGATWQAAIDNPDIPQGEDLMDDDLVYDEDDVISVVSIDDLLNEIGPVPHEKEAEAAYKALKPDGVFANLDEPEFLSPCERRRMNDEIRMHLREINELHPGNLSDVHLALNMPPTGVHALLSQLPDTEQFDMGEETTWYSQLKDGEELLYYEKSKQPITRGRQRATVMYDVEKEVERMGKKIQLRDILDNMTLSSCDTNNTPCTLSLASSSASSELSLSDIHDEEGETSSREKEKEPDPPAASVDLPPLNPCQVKERLHRWIGDVTPNTPEQMDTPLDRSTVDEEDEDDCESLPENYEIEAELRPAAALLSRPVPPEVLQTRFIRTQHTTTVAHLGEFLHQAWKEDVKERLVEGEAMPEIPKADYFYVFNRQDRHCKCVFVHESLVTAQTLTAREDHVVIYFDTQRAEISAKEMSLLDKIVPLKDRTDPTPASSRDSTGSSGSR